MSSKKNSTIIQFFWSIVLLSLFYFKVLCVSIDLNMFPVDDEFDQDLNKYTLSTEDRNHITEKPVSHVPDQKGPKVTPAQYAKVVALMKLLQICDSPNFNINKIPIPDSFAKENKAMMALKEVAKRNLIAKKDKEKFDRIMKNCSLLSKAVNEKTDNTLGPDSQMSGGYDEDREAQKLFEMRNSPLKSFENRFSETNRPSSDIRNQITQTPTAHITTTPEPTPQELVEEGVTMFKFL